MQIFRFGFEIRPNLAILRLLRFANFKIRKTLSIFDTIVGRILNQYFSFYLLGIQRIGILYPSITDTYNLIGQNSQLIHFFFQVREFLEET